MGTSRGLFSYLKAQYYRDKEEPIAQGFVTISRQAGAGGITIGEKLAVYLNKELPGTAPWTVFDKKLVDEIIRDNDLPQRLLSYLKEARIAAVKDTLEDLLGVHPPQSTLVEKSNQTILHLARRGRAILVGRGAPVITRFTAGGIHVRLVGSFKKRLAHIKEYYQLTDKEAEVLIVQEDAGRAQYLKKYFDRDINDPLLYDMVINTDTMSYCDVVFLIGDAVIRKIKVEAALEKTLP